MIGLEVMSLLRGVSYTEIGKAFGISRQAVCRWAKNKNIPEDRLSELAEMLDCPVKYLTTEINVESLALDINKYFA